MAETHLTTEEPNTLCMMMRSEENSYMKTLVLSKIDLTSVEPSLLPEAVEYVETDSLIKYLLQWFGAALRKTMANPQTSLQGIFINLSTGQVKKEYSMKADFLQGVSKKRYD